jgi:hypothetical protein
MMEASQRQAERIESLKSGIAAGAIATLIVVLLLGLHIALANAGTVEADQLWLQWTTAGWINGAIAVGSGFLFGITYRYIVRQDSNPQLRSGAVLAFAIVRGSAQIQGDSLLHPNWTPLVLTGVESLLLFGAIQISLDTAMQQGWIQPFPSKSD